jgi:hypothetical protein
MGEKESIKCLSEVSRTDPGLLNSKTRGAPSSKYIPNASRDRNEALDGGGVAGTRSCCSDVNFTIKNEPCREPSQKSSPLGERDQSEGKPELSYLKYSAVSQPRNTKGPDLKNKRNVYLERTRSAVGRNEKSREKSPKIIQISLANSPKIASTDVENSPQVKGKMKMDSPESADQFH